MGKFGRAPVGAFLGERVVVVKDVVADVDDSLLERRRVGPVVPAGGGSQLRTPGEPPPARRAPSATNTAIAARVRKRGGTRITNDSSVNSAVESRHARQYTLKTINNRPVGSCSSLDVRCMFRPRFA